MNEYFDPGIRPSYSTGCPVVPKKETWEVVESPQRLSKRFEFSERDRVLDFVQEIMLFEDQKRHHSMIRVDHLTVDVEVYTKDLNRITELDREFAVSVDRIYRDVLDYVYEKSQPYI